MTDPGLQPSATPVPGPAAPEQFAPAARPIAMLATFVLILLAVLALHEVSGMVVPVVFGLLLALVAAPLVGGFERRGASHRVAVTATIVAVLGVLVVTVLIIVFSIAQ